MKQFNKHSKKKTNEQIAFEFKEIYPTEHIREIKIKEHLYDSGPQRKRYVTFICSKCGTEVEVAACFMNKYKHQCNCKKNNKYYTEKEVKFTLPNNNIQQFDYNTIDKDILNKLEDKGKDQKIKELTKLNNQLVQTNKSFKDYIDNFHEISKEFNYNNNPNQHKLFDMDRIDEYNNNKSSITPCLIVCDTHWGKIVRSKYVLGSNDYNMDIADHRFMTGVYKFINFYKNSLNYEYDEIVIVLGGDLIENDLGHNNEQDGSIVEQVIRAGNTIVKGLNLIRDNFPNSVIRVIGVVGNHGRQISPSTGKYMPTYNILKTSYEYLIFDRIIKEGYFIECDDSNEVLFNVGSTRVLALHGYEQKINTKNPNSLYNTFKNKQQQMENMLSGFDILLLHHYHKPFNFDDKLIIGGSIVGFDDYSRSMGFDYFSPCMTSFAFVEGNRNTKIAHYHLIDV